MAKNSKEAQMRAMNEVLEVVGVTERKFKADDVREMPRVTLTASEWNAIQSAEDDVGYDISILVEFVDSILTWWIDVLRRRMQAGLVDCSKPFATIILVEWTFFRETSLTGKYHYLTAGLELELLGNILAVHAEDPLWSCIAWLRRNIREARLHPYLSDCLYRAVDVFRAS
ncbi:hypothetical protein CAC42_3225 [Sphaceloma murrayae]|uniref:Uncharacterized protein n=1 Tax=Sphaceloma murrayae TaxID=2082308 RepID=A0A2K1QSC3_9PEZI|nr:hypothetical protein CAC42_3225 [Sphaceloma murrayae]